jgi:4-amino-4-deoxy-L-arabinose transferase and related glycosyltransferases of PMT family
LSVGAIVFLGLLAVELPLLGAAFSKRPRVSTAARVLVFLVPLLLALGFRTAHAFSTHDVLDWDETYYASLAVTAASGHGLYPYIYGFGPMQIMGGTGYAAYSYALAVKMFGPTIFALRTVSLLASVAGLAGIWLLVKTWYGSGPAWWAAALTASLQLFVLSNSARMDSWTFAYVTWGLVAVAVAFDRWPDRRWHLLAGLIFGLGLQVHIDTVVTGAACGFLYFLRYLSEAREARRIWLPGHPMFMYVAGVLAGGALYVCVNILPDTASYYTMTVLVRVDATSSYSSGTSSIVGSFLDPRILFAKEAARYRQLVAITPPLEIVFLVAGIVTAAVRRNRADRLVLALVPAVAVGAAVLLNNTSPFYYIHVLPALIVPIAPLFTHGVRGQSKVRLSDVAPGALVASVVVVCVLCASAAARTVRTMRAHRPPPVSLETIQRVRALVDRRCKMAGDGGLYVPYFADYPYFISLRPTEVKHGLLYYGTTDEAAYWQIKQPDVVFATGALNPGLSQYVASRHLAQIEPGFWMNPSGCRPGP